MSHLPVICEKPRGLSSQSAEKELRQAASYHLDDSVQRQQVSHTLTVGFTVGFTGLKINDLKEKLSTYPFLSPISVCSCYLSP